MGPTLYMLLGAALASLGWWGYVRRAYVGPLARLRAAMKQTRRGRPPEAFEPEGAPPVRKAGHRLTQLLAQVDARQHEGLRQREALRGLVDALPDPILLAGADEALELVNRPAAALLGVEPEAAVGRPVARVLGDRRLLKLFDKTARRKTGRPREGAATRTRVLTLPQDGVPHRFAATARRTAAGSVLVVLRDVTAVAGAARMKTDFVANASHELRTPVAAMRLAAETLEAAVEDDDRALILKSGRIVAGHLKRLGDLVNDLLHLGRIEEADYRPRIEPLGVREAMAPHVAVIGQLAEEKGVAVTWPAHAAEACVHADRRLFDLIVKNLAENAVKYTPAGGSVTVDLDVGAQAVLRVSDTGIGIPAELRERVFERFFQVDQARTTAEGRGTGLGLSIVKHAAGAMKGHVRLGSEVGRGTTITVTLPQPREV